MTMNKINDGRFSSGSFYLVNEQFEITTEKPRFNEILY